MSKIHSTAIVDKSAQLHGNVEVGAFSIIGPNVIIGEGTVIGPHANITGHTVIGKNNKIFHGASVGEIPQDKKYAGEPMRLVLGDNNIVREFCTLHIGTITGHQVTTIGNNNMFMAYVHVAHDCIIGDNTILANSVSLGGHVQVKDWAILGGHAIVHQFTTIGEHAMLSGATGADRDVPPYTMALGYRAEPKGINSEGLKRRGFSAQQIENIKHAYKLLYRSNLLYEDAKAAIAELAKTQTELQVYVHFFASSQRSIIR